MQTFAANYLHYGDAVDSCNQVALSRLSGSIPKLEFLRQACRQRVASAYLAEIIRDYGLPRTRSIPSERFARDLAQTSRLRGCFQALGCRGFSFKFVDDVQLFEPLRHEIGLRMALVPDAELFYPRRVKRYLRRVNSNHYFWNGFPSIAFALGLQSAGAWWVLVMQSDLALRSPSYIRDHFRGWRKVLFLQILRMAAGKAGTVYLSEAQGALRSCHPDYPRPRRTPDSWLQIYDRTADFFHMESVQVKTRINVQVFAGQPPVYAERLYALKLSPEVRAAITRLCGGEP